MSEKYNICLDVGGTKVLGAIFDEKDKIIYRLKKRSKSGGSASADVEKVIIDVVEEMIKESGIDRKKLNAVASCAPGVIDQDNGIVLFTPNLPWRDYDMAGAMRKQFGVPFYVGLAGLRHGGRDAQAVRRALLRRQRRQPGRAG